MAQFVRKSFGNRVGQLVLVLQAVCLDKIIDIEVDLPLSSNCSVLPPGERSAPTSRISACSGLDPGHLLRVEVFLLERSIVYSRRPSFRFATGLSFSVGKRARGESGYLDGGALLWFRECPYNPHIVRRTVLSVATRLCEMPKLALTLPTMLSKISLLRLASLSSSFHWAVAP